MDSMDLAEVEPPNADSTVVGTHPAVLIIITTTIIMAMAAVTVMVEAAMEVMAHQEEDVDSVEDEDAVEEAVDVVAETKRPRMVNASRTITKAERVESLER